ncbi:uncharacterized protein SAMN05216480_106161 [Pustulibacterium marinum]|uniref:DUF418 domain-containing protein n=1 Tax=Pustulibacterium marinum TaxID=1224947 RepID=A0A1I7H0L7_9FLAO|nr:DUF418 domain-containing protein [Pustulibacterium marinum]SFU54217.1 uncharacterized protein SAMN05216480_106161 [Pustulibacterium marinum]
MPPEQPIVNRKNRLEVVDALRGFALVSIMLLHNLEHFDFYFKPKFLPEWMKTLDTYIWDFLFFMFAGKSYAMFALLFGLTFFIQKYNQEKRGQSFDGRFAWRMILLIGFGFINSLFFQGDILMFYAFVGFLLIPTTKLPAKWMYVIIVLMFIQPVQIIALFNGIQHPVADIPSPPSWQYFGQMKTYIPNDSFWETVKGNLFNGRKAVVLWTFENGRFFHMLALFLSGYLLGKHFKFVENPKNRKFWRLVFFSAVLLYIPQYVFQLRIDDLIATESIRRPLKTITNALENITFMVVILSSFVLLFYLKSGRKILNVFSPVGKMSLTNYVLQSIVGSTIYFGFGFGLYQYTGATYSFIIAMILTAGMIAFSTWWMNRHKHGPLEGIWHRLTWMGSKKK